MDYLSIEWQTHICAKIMTLMALCVPCPLKMMKDTFLTLQLGQPYPFDELRPVPGTDFAIPCTQELGVRGKQGKHWTLMSWHKDP